MIVVFLFVALSVIVFKSKVDMTDSSDTADKLRAIGEAQHAAKCAEAKANFTQPVVFHAKRWSEAATTEGDWRSNPNTKLIHFVRHGQGYHNLLGEVARHYGAQFSETGDYDVAVKENCPYMLPAILDPPLTAIGREDAKKLQHMQKRIIPELFVTSPMKRAAQTILIGFSDQLQKSSSPVPMIAHEGCREQCGVFLCDKRSKLSDYKEEFPRIDYSLMEGQGGGTDADDDGMWKMKQRETMLEMSYRAHSFLQWVFDREGEDVLSYPIQ